MKRKMDKSFVVMIRKKFFWENCKNQLIFVAIKLKKLWLVSLSVAATLLTSWRTDLLKILQLVTVGVTNRDNVL